MTFIPFWENCIIVTPDFDPEGLSDAVDQFKTLYGTCTVLGKNEISNLMQSLSLVEDSASCDVNVTSIVSVMDMGDQCANMDGVIGESTADVPGGPYTCPGLAAKNLCSYADAACCDSCLEEDPECAEAGCTAAGRRSLAEKDDAATYYEFVKISPFTTDTCPLDSFDDRNRALSRVCCGKGAQSCINGLPMQCTYECGRMLGDFLRDCGTVLERWVHAAEGSTDPTDVTMRQYTQFMDKCYHLDVRSVVMAIYSADCWVCGDGNVNRGESCDDGEGNCDDAGCKCHSDCTLGTDGLSQQTAALGCVQIKEDFPGMGNGNYWLDPDGDGNVENAAQMYCDMDDGGWTYVSEGKMFEKEYTGGTQTLITASFNAEYYFELEGGAGGIGDPEDHEQCPPADNSFPEDKDGSSYHEHYDAEPTGGYGGLVTGAKTFPASTPLYVEVGGQGVQGGLQDSDWPTRCISPPGTQSHIASACKAIKRDTGEQCDQACCTDGIQAAAGHPARCQAIGQNGRGASGDGTPCALNAEESDCASTACVDGACAPGVDGADCGPGTDEATCVAITNPDAPDATCVWTAGNEGACGMGQCQYVEKYLAPDSTCVSYKDCHTHKDMATQVWHSDRGAYNGGGRGSAGGSGGGGATDIRLVADDLDSRVLVAGGGGGCGYDGCECSGGPGGGLEGLKGNTQSDRGKPGTQIGRGAGAGWDENGGFGRGGDAPSSMPAENLDPAQPKNSGCTADMGGGGGGWWGGSTGDADNSQAAGGSSFYAAMDTNRNTTADVNPGPGVVRYRYRQAACRDDCTFDPDGAQFFTAALVVDGTGVAEQALGEALPGSPGRHIVIDQIGICGVMRDTGPEVFRVHGTGIDLYFGTGQYGEKDNAEYGCEDCETQFFEASETSIGTRKEAGTSWSEGELGINAGTMADLVISHVFSEDTDGMYCVGEDRDGKQYDDAELHAGGQAVARIFIYYHYDKGGGNGQIAHATGGAGPPGGGH